MSPPQNFLKCISEILDLWCILSTFSSSFSWFKYNSMCLCCCLVCLLTVSCTVDRDVFEDSMVEAKAKATKFCPRGVLEVEASLRGPRSLGFLPRNATQRAVMPRRLSVHHSQMQRPTVASCACV